MALTGANFSNLAHFSMKGSRSASVELMLCSHERTSKIMAIVTGVRTREG